MSNDDLSLEDLSPNILADWEQWASGTHPDSSPGFAPTADHRKIIALVRAVQRLRTRPAPKVMQQTMVAGFHGGWAAAMRTLADELEKGAMRARLGARGRNVQVALDPLPLARNLLKRATQPPTPQVVAMKPGETAQQATDRVGDAPLEGLPAPEGAFPGAQEALPLLAAILAVLGGDRHANQRAARAEWVAICAFALFTRDCARMDGLGDELDRAAEETRALVFAEPPTETRA